VKALGIGFEYSPGTGPGEGLDLGFTIGAGGARGTAYRGSTPMDAPKWTWDGQGSLGDAYLAGAKELLAASPRLRVEGDATAGALIEAIAALLGKQAPVIGLGEPLVLERAPETGPVVRFGTPIVTGDLDKAIVRRYLRRNAPKLKYCYEKELAAKPELSGTVASTWTISPDGKVEDAKSKGVDDAVATCVSGVIASIEFPKPTSGSVTVSFPLSYSVVK
jgi:hypothetical protein